MRRKTLVRFCLAILSALATVSIISSSVTFHPDPTPAATVTTKYNYARSGGNDVSQLPLGHSGTTQFLIEPSPYSVRPGKSRDTFRTSVKFTHFLKDDPIVSPGKPGMSHLHTFFGNASLNAFTTADNIRTNCRSAAAGGTANCTGYWVPALFDANGSVVLPSAGEHLIYYKAGYDIPDPTKIVAVPMRLRMLAGNSKATFSLPQTDNKARFWCHARSNSDQPYIVDCPQGSVLEMTVVFPRCWDGKNLDSPNHKSHMAYANNGCPASHPVIFPEISYHFQFPVNSPSGTAGWRLSSDEYDRSRRGGYSLHADWFNGWEPAVINRWVKNCDRAQVDCGVNVLGDGGWLSTKFLNEISTPR